MFLVNSRKVSFAAGRPLPRATRPYSEVTATALPSSQTRVLSYILAHFAPTHLCRFTVRVYFSLTLAAFLGFMFFPLAPLARDLRSHRGLRSTDLPINHRSAPNVIAIGRGKVYEAFPLQ